MSKQVRAGVLTVSLLAGAFLGTASGGASAAAPIAGQAHMSSTQTVARVAVNRAAVKRGATVKTSANQVTEGDRYTVTARVKSPTQAAKVTLEKFRPPLYDGGRSYWDTVKITKTRGKAKTKFGVVATSENTERYRAVVTYKNAKPVKSKPVNVTVSRWIPLSDYAPYYNTGGTGFGTATINGQAYKGWGAAAYSHTGAWDTRFTPGRNCQSFRGILGLGDISNDGSTGTIQFTADDAPTYQSPTLTPGMAVPVTIPLPQPYRFGIQLTDTTPGGTTGRDPIQAWPVIGDPAFLCTGI